MTDLRILCRVLVLWDRSLILFRHPFPTCVYVVFVVIVVDVD